MTRIGFRKALVAFVIVAALVTAPLALAGPGQGRGDEARGPDGDHGRPDWAGSDANGNETLQANETEELDVEDNESDDGPPAHVLEKRAARENGTWTPPGLHVALENVPDFLKDHIQSLIDTWSTRGDANASAADASEDAVTVDNTGRGHGASNANAGNETDARGQGMQTAAPHGNGPAHAQGNGHGLATALENVPTFVRAKFQAFLALIA